MLKEATGKAPMEIIQDYKWHKCFRDGRVSVMTISAEGDR
jgi:hypothetical protein